MKLYIITAAHRDEYNEPQYDSNIIDVFLNKAAAQKAFDDHLNNALGCTDFELTTIEANLRTKAIVIDKLYRMNAYGTNNIR